MQLTLAYLYPDLMNIYGDQGNIQAFKFRCQHRQIKLIINPIHPKTSLKPGSFDLLFAGGGQDQQQQLISLDLFSRRQVLLKAVLAGIPMLTICGSYQLFGQYFKPSSGAKMTGIGIFNAYTVASKQRKIGNIIIETKWGKLVGFENHSGNTFLQNKTKPLGTVIIGQGNNGQDKTEGAVKINAFGCYLHGSLLPKNPHFCDYLIQLALAKKYGTVLLKPLNDQLEWQAHFSAISRTRKLRHPLLKYL